MAVVERPERLRTSYLQEYRLVPGRAAAIRLALFAAVLVVAPFLLSDVWVSITIFAAIAGIGALGLNVLTGLGGLVSIGHAFFIGVGAYAAAVLGGQPEPGENVVGFGLPWPVWLMGSGLVAALIGAAVGPLALRFRGLYLSIVTLALVYIGAHVFASATPLTGGSMGRFVPSPSFGGISLSTGLDVVIGPLVLSTEQRWYFFVVILAVPLALAARNIALRRSGRALQAVRGGDLAASVIGIDVTRVKIAAFAFSSGYAGIAGALLASYIGSVRAESFGLALSIEYLAMIVIGGMGSVLGSFLGALFVTALPELGREVLPGGVGHYNIFEASAVVYGIILMIFLIAYPQGLIGMWDRVKAYWRAWPFR